jgi:hypothetical protein
MKFFSKKLILLAIMSASITSAAYGLVHQEGPTLLDSLNRGMWQFRAIGGGPTGTAVNRLCVGDAKKLLQIQHQEFDCKQFIVRSSPNALTVSYSCSGQGQGMTSIRKESNSLIQINSQGIRNNSPFSFSVEARQSGGC